MSKFTIEEKIYLELSDINTVLRQIRDSLMEIKYK